MSSGGVQVSLMAAKGRLSCQLPLRAHETATGGSYGEAMLELSRLAMSVMRLAGEVRSNTRCPSCGALLSFRACTVVRSGTAASAS